MYLFTKILTAALPFLFVSSSSFAGGCTASEAKNLAIQYLKAPEVDAKISGVFVGDPSFLYRHNNDIPYYHVQYFLRKKISYKESVEAKIPQVSYRIGELQVEFTNDSCKVYDAGSTDAQRVTTD